VHAFLEQWGLINYQVSSLSKPVSVGTYWKNTTIYFPRSSPVLF
jgi:hypothetical protein